MRFNILIALISLVLCVLMDLYIYKIIRKRLPGHCNIAAKIHAVTAILGYGVIITAIALPRQSGENSVLVADMWLIFIFLTMLVSKLIFCISDWIAHIPRIIGFKRSRWLSAIGIALATGIFISMWWGALINRNRISVTETTVESPRWPQSFDGYRIIQISDLHTGTWGTDTTFLSQLVNRINSLDADLIVFTGDIVNRRSDEFEPMVSTFGRMQARDGVYAILGNHDYGDYSYWPSDKEHMADRENLRHLYKLTGHRLLLNETEYLTRGNDSIALIGVENIGEPPFATYGDLSKAYANIGDSLPKILLTHNPAHWTADIRNNPKANIDLTLSGHTHAMQIQIAGRTPSSLRYETPWGIYTDSLAHTLNVNRGAGTVGMPMRLGATPEITVITLHKAR